MVNNKFLQDELDRLPSILRYLEMNSDTNSRIYFNIRAREAAAILSLFNAYIKKLDSEIEYQEMKNKTQDILDWVDVELARDIQE